MRPDLRGPLNHVINRHGIPRPPGTEDANYFIRFRVEQWAPYAALSSMFNRGASLNSGFAVDVWRPNPFDNATDIFTNAPVNNLFSGIQADVAVRDIDAIIHRLSYHITLLGQIVFVPLVIL